MTATDPANPPAPTPPAPKADPPKFEPIASQEDFDRALGARLERERAKFADYDELQKKAAEFDKAQDANKTEAQKLADENAANKGRADTAETAALRFEVAIEKGLTKSQAKRLVGATREELEKDADELIADLGGKPEGGDGDGVTRRPAPNLRPGGGPAPEPEQTDPAKLAGSVPRGY